VAYYQLGGFELDSFKWHSNKDTSVHFKIRAKVEAEQIEEVEIKSKKNTVADKVEMSRIDIPINQIKEIPALFGEKDVLKVIQLLPGVQTGGEGQSGLYVRGGGPDQNLMLLDEAIVYNASHLFGFFSVFNGDALKSVELVKGGFPARYGGRLSSVIDLSMKEGNNQRYTGEVGVGILSSRFTFEGPIKKGKSSFMISGRRTYIDLLIQPFLYAATGNNGGYYFYDFNAKANYTLSEKDRLYLSGYFGKDEFYTKIREGRARLDTDFGWGNRTVTARWNHVFSPKLFSNASIIYSHYKLNIVLESYDGFRDTFSLNYQSVIDDIGFKYDFDWRPHPNHQVRYGIQTTRHQFRPAALVIKAAGFGDLQNKISTINTYESGIYIEDVWKLGKLQVNPGFRLSHYAVEKTTFVNPEPRFSASYNITPDLAIKGSYARMFQYIHLLSNSGISLPTDLWIPATAGLRPMRSEQTAIGIAKDFNKGFSITWEAYYKDMKDVVQYREGASFLLEDDIFSSGAVGGGRNWEQQITRGDAWSYGTELFLQKKTGAFTGWIGYTLSWTQMKFPELNGGKPFYARYDRRHDISIVGSYKVSKKINVALTWVYGTGNAVTLAQGYIPGNNHQMSAYPITWSPQMQSYNNFIDFGSRNDFRMESYHRLDLGIQFHKQKKNGMQTWEVSLYNAYNQANPFFYYSVWESNNRGETYSTLKKVTLFPVLPSVSWSFKFK
jgi:outer membrane receptor for ferrienterochelin and colicin